MNSKLVLHFAEKLCVIKNKSLLDVRIIWLLATCKISQLPKVPEASGETQQASESAAALCA